mmetsp:Transcript_13200/g.20502  ORF Transcript_13200/g.20502 Transcript_13200/m.20502 type:complete len:577 (+) Transcript_13200:197-1927(+)|eukprot:CAMPEP_0194224696 /NCGR_PEP_ID=MMETSP0156-20130528/38004_1 /TAXON_ID=33649 /ORGANISM="Thalassionema nitzschioides, Strain L26-B" /LENGTH=576 /DNA_ID=CAMNT_0038956373 /DNA_START=196 /DNA_END=1926 /DNA_ORIENTATION=+
MLLRAVLLSLLPAASQGHFLFQQAATAETGSSVSSIFTFAEVPGLQNAGQEWMAKAAYSKGVNANFRVIIVDEDYGDDDQRLTTVIAGKYISADLPDTLPEAYVLEGSCVWGIREEGEKGLALLKYYTSASRSRSKNEAEKVHAASTNDSFRIDLGVTDDSECSEQGTEEPDASVCVQVAVIFHGSPLPSHAITFYQGDTSDPVKIVSDENGYYYLSVSKGNIRVFARANHDVDTPGEFNGTNYDAVSNWATSVLELGDSLEKYSLEISSSDSPNENPHDDHGGDYGGYHHGEYGGEHGGHHNGDHTGSHIMDGFQQQEESSDPDDPPSPFDKAAFARWIAHNTIWGSLATINSRNRQGTPFGNIASFSDGPKDDSVGVLYMLHSGLDASMIDVALNDQIGFSVSEMQTGYCQGKKIDPEDPRCARLSISGRLVEVEPVEIETAKLAMFDKHPSMKGWYKDNDTTGHNFKFYKIQMEEIWLIDYFGGAATIDNEAWNRGTDNPNADTSKPKFMKAALQQDENGTNSFSVRFPVIVSIIFLGLGFFLGRKSMGNQGGFEKISQEDTSSIKLAKGEAC